MNVMLASGGYPWTVIPLDTHVEYMAALEEASVRKNIEPFAIFLAKLVQKGQTLPNPGKREISRDSVQ